MMVTLDIEVDARTHEGVLELAQAHYGDKNADSVNLLVATAVIMRLGWAQLVGEVGEDVEEPVVAWESCRAGDGKGIKNGITSWLFKEGGTNEAQ
jgi:hypothetical protein